MNNTIVYLAFTMRDYEGIENICGVFTTLEGAKRAAEKYTVCRGDIEATEFIGDWVWDDADMQWKRRVTHTTDICVEGYELDVLQ